MTGLRRRAWLLAVVPVCLGLVGCGKPTAAQGPPPERPPEVVQVSEAITRPVTDFEIVTGRTEAIASVDVRARANGYLTAIHFKDGADIRKGQLLFEIDPTPYQDELSRAEATLAQAEARRKRLEADFGRASRMVATRAMNREEFDKIGSDLAEAEAGVKVARAQRDLAEHNLGYTRVLSPLDGRISRRNVDPGNVIKADDTILTTVVALDPLYVTFFVDERTLLRLGQLTREGVISPVNAESTIPVQLGLADEEGFPHQGVLDFVDNRLDPSTGTLRVRGVFPNPHKLLVPGLYARVRVPVGNAHPATLVPERALGTDQGQKFLYVVDDKNEVVYRSVSVGSLHDVKLRDSDAAPVVRLRAVKDGVKPGERVVVNGLQRVRPGSKVEPKPAQEPQALGRTTAERGRTTNPTRQAARR